MLFVVTVCITFGVLVEAAIGYPRKMRILLQFLLTTATLALFIQRSFLEEGSAAVTYELKKERCLIEGIFCVQLENTLRSTILNSFVFLSKGLLFVILKPNRLHCVTRDLCDFADHWLAAAGADERDGTRRT